MRKALKEAGWIEVKNKDFDEELDCKFSFGQNDINFRGMKKGCWINQNPNEGALTMKSDLVTSL
jgi:hypothetical protein